MGLLATVLAVATTALAPAPAPTLSVRDAVGGTLVMRFHGTAPPGYVAQALRDGDAAGVILFRDNCVSPEQTRMLTAAIRRAGGPGTIVALDQEGGAIRILPWAAPALDQADVTAPQAIAAQTARALADEGVNLNLAPVADLSGPGSVMRTRAFAGDPATVARRVRAAVRGYAGTGVAPTLKHFPGLGGTDANTDQQSATIAIAADELGRTALPPFAAGIDAGAPAVMLSHALYPSLDGDRIASQSRPIVTGLLRDRLGFDGVIMTDSLEAYSVRARSSIETAAVRSVRAGVDLILTTGAGSHIRIERNFRALARRDPAFLSRLKAATTRVRALRRTLADR